MAKRKIWTRLLIAAVIILIGWAVFVSSKQIQRNRRIQEEVAALEREASKIQSENETLSERIDYLSSSDFREQEAKKKLGLKKTEEVLAVIKPSLEYNKDEDAQNETIKNVSENQDETDMPNYKKWWKAFF
jgi:cell division protein FtsB